MSGPVPVQDFTVTPVMSICPYCAVIALTSFCQAAGQALQAQLAHVAGPVQGELRAALQHQVRVQLPDTRC